MTSPGGWKKGTALPEPTADSPAAAFGQSARVTVLGQVDAAHADAALALADAAAEADGVAPLSEQARLQLRYGGDPAAANLFRWQGPNLAGFARLGSVGRAGERSGELVVHPQLRRRGHGRALVRAVVAQAAGAPVRIWAHGDLPAAARLAAAEGFARTRSLWRMRRLLDPPAGEPVLPAGVSVREFAPGRDEEAWLALNAQAFAGHPEQGAWTRDDLDRREREPWFDPAGFFLAERNGQLVGFHWTKAHARRDEMVGEVYVIGTGPGARGSGLARALTLIGLRHLRERGATSVMLYVDEANTPAIRLYTSLGFIRDGVDVMYGRGRETSGQAGASPQPGQPSPVKRPS